MYAETQRDIQKAAGETQKAITETQKEYADRYAATQKAIADSQKEYSDRYAATQKAIADPQKEYSDRYAKTQEEVSRVNKIIGAVVAIGETITVVATLANPILAFYKQRVGLWAPGHILVAVYELR